MPFRVGFCVSGAGRLFRAAVRRQDELAIQPALLVAGPHADADLELFCADHGMPMVRVVAGPRERFAHQITRACIDAELELLCLTFDRILPAELVKHYRGRIINTHLSLLPAFKGLRPLSKALTAGAQVVGATIHEVVEAVDSGPIIAQCARAVERMDTESTLGSRLFELVRPMFLQVIAWYAADRIVRDDHGRLWVRGARYGQLPIVPAVEQAFAE